MDFLKDTFGVARAYTNLANTFMLLQVSIQHETRFELAWWMMAVGLEMYT